jgi:hypothetical protein
VVEREDRRFKVQGFSVSGCSQDITLSIRFANKCQAVKIAVEKRSHNPKQRY